MSGKRISAAGWVWLLVLLLSLTASAQTAGGGENAHSETPAQTGDAAAEPAVGESEEREKTPAEDFRLRRGAREYALEIGSSPFNPSNFAGPKEYDVYGRDLHLSTFRFGRVIGTKGPVTYQYLFGATPLAVFTGNEIRNPAFVSHRATPRIAPTVRRTSWGVAVQPVNFRFIFLPGRRLKPFAQVGAGILLTSRSVPVPRSTPFNFTGDFGGGVQYFTAPNRAVTFGYKYFHISNGNIGGKINNPGYNANVFYIAYSFFKL